MRGPNDYPTVLDKMINEPLVQGPVGEILRELNIGKEAEYNGPVAIVGVDKLIADTSFGSCDVIGSNGVSFLVVNDVFPFALEQAGIPENTAWYAAAIFAGLKEAIHTRAVFGLPRTQSVVGAAIKFPSIGEKYWGPNSKESRAINRLAAGLTLRHVGITANTLDLPGIPPYPNHIAAFIDPIILDV